MIYFDNAATSFPKPIGVKNAAMNFFTKYGGNPGRGGHNISIATAQMVFEAREALKNFFNAYDEENIVFTSNCTYATNNVINGILKKGDHVIISDMEHNSVSRPIKRLESEGLITFDIAQTYTDDEQTVNSFKKLIKPNTKLIACMHASNILGNVLPIEQIGKLCKDNKVLFMVDAAQSAGVLPIDVKKDNIDFLCIAAHKGLYCASGMGVLITDKGELLRPMAVGGTGSQSQSFEQPNFMPDKLESGTCNTMGICTVKAGIDFINTKGMDKLYENEILLSKILYDNLAQLDKVKIYSAVPEKYKAVPIVAFNVEGYTSEELCAYLNENDFCLRGGLHCSPLAHKKAGTIDTGIARASFGAFNNQNEIKKMVNIIKKL